MVDEGKDVEAIVGAPVGFVGAAESKYELEKTDIPHIVVQGRKGGSNVAAAIINAILYAMQVLIMQEYVYIDGKKYKRGY